MVRLNDDTHVPIPEALPAAELRESIKAAIPDMVALLKDCQFYGKAAVSEILLNFAQHSTFCKVISMFDPDTPTVELRNSIKARIPDLVTLLKGDGPKVDDSRNCQAAAAETLSNLAAHGASRRRF